MMSLIRVCSNCGYSEDHDYDEDEDRIGQNSDIKCPNCDEYAMSIKKEE